MSPVPIDTQGVVDRLTDAGVPERQAKAHASVLLDSLRHQASDIGARTCSKDDLRAALSPVVQSIGHLEAHTAALEGSVARVDAKIDATAARQKSELITWVVSIGLLQSALISGLLLKLPG